MQSTLGIIKGTPLEELMRDGDLVHLESYMARVCGGGCEAFNSSLEYTPQDCVLGWRQARGEA